MSRETVPAYNEDTRYHWPVFGTLLLVLAVLLLFDPWGWTTSEPSKADPNAARCWEIPPKYGGRTFCSDMQEGGNHGYVNPGSMEWEVE